MLAHSRGENGCTPPATVNLQLFSHHITFILTRAKETVVHKLSTTLQTRTPWKAFKIAGTHARTHARSSQRSFDSRATAPRGQRVMPWSSSRSRSREYTIPHLTEALILDSAPQTRARWSKLPRSARSSGLSCPLRARGCTLAAVYLQTIDSVLAGVNSPSQGDEVTIGGTSSPGSFLLFSRPFWGICELSVEKGFPELICFPPRSLRIIMYLQMIHQSAHWSHMSSRRREKTKWKRLEEKTQPRKMLFLSRPVATIAMSHGGLVMTSPPMMS